MTGAMGVPPVSDAPPALAVRRHFMGWQCRLRQFAVREQGGKPGAGMCPEAHVGDNRLPLGRVTVLIVRRDAEPVAAELRHLCKRTLDPADRYASAIQYLSAAYYQKPDSFDDEMTALFGPDSNTAVALLDAGLCLLTFEQFSQRYELFCRVRALDRTEPAFQATYWHNSLFNSGLPGEVTVLGFSPDWVTARAEPSPV